MLHQILLISQILLSVILTGFILVQTRGNGLGRTFGGGTASFTRRGIEKSVFRATFVITFLFIAISIFSVTLG